MPPAIDPPAGTGDGERFSLRQAALVWSVLQAFQLCDALSVREAFAHDAIVQLTPGGDDGATGAAITVALCGHWEHEPPCPLAPHHTRAERAGNELRLRTLFAVEPEFEDEVRQRIDAALASSKLVGPDGAATIWQLHAAQRGDVLETEFDHAGRLIRS